MSGYVGTTNVCLRILRFAKHYHLPSGEYRSRKDVEDVEALLNEFPTLGGAECENVTIPAFSAAVTATVATHRSFCLCGIVVRTVRILPHPSQSAIADPAPAICPRLTHLHHKGA